PVLSSDRPRENAEIVTAFEVAHELFGQNDLAVLILRAGAIDLRRRGLHLFRRELSDLVERADVELHRLLGRFKEALLAERFLERPGYLFQVAVLFDLLDALGEVGEEILGHEGFLSRSVTAV